MKRDHYAKVTRKDKLHRTEKDAARAEKLLAEERAQNLPKSLKKEKLKDQAHKMPFYIGRTGTNNIPVYEHVKNGGSKKITTLRKLSGDLVALQSALQKALELPESYLNTKGQKRTPVQINELTQQINIQGWRAAEVKSWAQTIGF